MSADSATAANPKASPIGLPAVAHGGSPRIFTVAGSGSFTIGGDSSPLGRPATLEELSPDDVAVATNGDLLVADGIGGRVWRIVRSGIVRLAAGRGGISFRLGDGGPATAAAVSPQGLAALPDGGFLISEGDRIRRVWPSRIITTVAGNGKEGHSGDGGPATAAALDGARAVSPTADGGFLILEQAAVRRVRPDGVIATVAGVGIVGFGGDGGPATEARIDLGGDAEVLSRGDIAALADGGFLLADSGNNRVRRVSAEGVITTVAGDGRRASRGDGGPAVLASLRQPGAVAALPDGGFLVSDTFGRRIRRVSSDGRIVTAVGSGVEAPDGAGVPVGDGGGPRAALVAPFGRGLVVTRARDVLFTDFSRVRLVAATRRVPAALAVTGVGGAVVRLATSTRAGVARVVVRTPRGRVVARGRRRARGVNVSLPIRPHVAPGRYWVRATLTAAHGRRAETVMALVVGSRLSTAAARHALAYELAAGSAAFGLETWVERCRRMARRRVDCQGYVRGDCDHIGAVTLRRGFAYVRPYRCAGGFRRRPQWRGPAQPWPLLGAPPAAVGSRHSVSAGATHAAAPCAASPAWTTERTRLLPKAA